jgi:hypothetical protein
MRTPFNTPLETGVRALTVLAAVFPLALDLQRLTEFDYLLVHSGDAGGPPSLHAPLPYRSGELLVRRALIYKGLHLMMSRFLIRQVLSKSGIAYAAAESANPFLNALSSDYIVKLRERAIWIDKQYGRMPEEKIRQITHRFFEKWTVEFQPIESTAGGGQ